MKRLARSAGSVLVVVAVVAACGSSEDPTRGDLPTDVVAARPSITVDEAKFVLAAKDLGVDVTGASVDDDLETAKTVCWALKEGGVEVKDMASQLGEDDDARTKRLMKAAIESLCPQFDGQVSQLDLPK